MALRKNQLCYYEVSGGKIGETPSTDDFLIFKVVTLYNANLGLMIGEMKTDDFMDYCENLSVGDILFARVPYRFFPLFVANEMNAYF